MDLINKLELPFISWFVDNPHLILYSYEGLTSHFSLLGKCCFLCGQFHD